MLTEQVQWELLREHVGGQIVSSDLLDGSRSDLLLVARSQMERNAGVTAMIEVVELGNDRTVI